jgi:SM-20-related protein
MIDSTMHTSTSLILDSIAKQGYAIIEDFLNPKEIQLLIKQAKDLQSSEQMHKASTGRNKGLKKNLNIRGDFIYWIESHHATEGESIYLQSMYEIQKALNQTFFLGLFELESHFAIYPSGSFYQKHLDQFIGKEERKVSSILYLNNEWKDEDGGHLRLFLDKESNTNFIDIRPLAGRLVIFLSSEFLHEVLPAKRERISLTGWFRTRSVNI